MSPSAIHSDPPSAPSAASTRWNTRGRSSSKSRDALNSRLMECSSRRRSISSRNSSADAAGALKMSVMAQGRGSGPGRGPGYCSTPSRTAWARPPSVVLQNRSI